MKMPSRSPDQQKPPQPTNETEDRPSNLALMPLSPASKKQWSVLLVAALLAGLAVFSWDWFPRSLDPAAGTIPGSRIAERPQVYLGPPNSLAVLPFTGGAAGEEPEFWSAGFSRELHRLFTRTPGLRVTSRNSSFFFQDPSLPKALIAERLQARFLLWGEFKVTEGRVRVDVKLYDARMKKEAWSGEFEGAMDDVFSIQDEILASCSGSIQPGYNGDLPRSQPVSTEAWSVFQEGLYHQAQRSPDGYESAEKLFLQTLQLDPGYLMARISLAELWLGKSAAGGNADHELVEAARAELLAALQADPNLPEALGLLSYIQRSVDWDWGGAFETATTAVGLNPGDPELMSTASLAMFSLGKFQEALDLLSQSVAQDPLNLARRLRLGLLLEFAGEYDEALKRYRQIIRMNPDFPGVRAYRARVRIIQEKPESALKESEQEVDAFWRRYAQILAFSALGNESEVAPLIESMMLEDGPHSAFQVAEILAFRGEHDLAFDWLQRAIEQRDGGVGEILGDWFLASLHGDPRWRELVSQLGLPGEPGIQ